MNNTRPIAIGLDEVIQDVQTTLYSELSAQWSTEVDAYGRVYKRIADDDKVIPAWYVAENDYKEVNYNDEFPCCVMFVDNDEHQTQDEFTFTCNVKAIFMVDLSRILPNNLGRADMIAQDKVVEILRNNAHNRFSVTGITKGVKNVFRGFDTSRIKFTDGHPYHCFSVNLDVEYYLTDKC